MKKFVKSYGACKLCAKEKNMSYDSHKSVNCLFDTFAMDFDGSIPETNRKFRYIPLRVKNLTGWVNLRATAGQTVDLAITFFKEEIVKQFGNASLVLTGQGLAFLSAAWKNALKPKETYVRVTANYSPQSNGRLRG